MSTIATGALEWFFKCKKQSGSITKDFFVRPEDIKFFTKYHNCVIDDETGTADCETREPELYAQLMEQGRGQRFDDPLFFI